MSHSFETYEEIICAQEKRVREETEKLFKLHQSRPAAVVANTTFQSVSGPITLSELFGESRELILIHNMGKSCPYCTLWADGLIGLAPHLKNRAALVLINNDSVDEQATFAASRGWPFKMASALGTSFSKDMGFLTIDSENKNESKLPGVSIFVKNEDGTIVHKTRAGFGPGDLFCSFWNFAELLPGGVGPWSPKFRYESQPQEVFRFSPNIALNVRNFDEAVSFYRDTLGFQIVGQPTAKEGLQTQKGGLTFWLDEVESGSSNKQDSKVGQVFFEFTVGNLDEARAQMKSKGCMELESTSGAGFRGQMLADPFGMKFHLYQPIQKTIQK